MRVFGFIAAVILTLITFFSEKITEKIPKKPTLISFAAGMMVSYMFLTLFPAVYGNVKGLPLEFYIVLAGFVLVHMVEKYFSQRGYSVSAAEKVYAIHTIVFLIYNFLSGVAFYFFQANPVALLLFLIPVAVHTLFSTTLLEKLPSVLQRSTVAAVLLASAPIFGAVAPSLLPDYSSVFNYLFAFAVGAIFYVVVRDEIPSGKKGRPSWFFYGVLLYAALVWAFNLL